MEGLKQTPLLERAKQQGVSVSWKQFESYECWGLIPEQPGGGWTEADIERLRQIRDCEKQARSLHRRVILLQDSRWPIAGKYLRRAMIDTIPAIDPPQKKMRAVYRATQVRYGSVSTAKAHSLPLPASWRPPKQAEWQDMMRWPSDEDFKVIFGAAWSDTQALIRAPLVVESRLIEDIPIEEITILLMTQQLRLTPQSLPTDEEVL